MLSIGHIITQLERVGKVRHVDRELSPYCEPTPYLREAESSGRTLVFRVFNSPLTCAGPIITSRDMLLKLLGASADEDAYERLLKDPPKKGWFVERDFSEYFERLDVGVGNLPSIKFYEGDGGRYITTSVVIARIPGTNTYNASVHRLMLYEGKGFAIRLVPRHLYRIYRENLLKGVETPVAVMIGASPTTLLSASVSLPYGVFELSLHKSLTGEAIKLAFTPRYGLPVDVTSSVVLEGRLTEELVDEGPFVDLLNLYDRRRKQPLLKVDSIYVNKAYEPYFHVLLPGGIEHQILMGFPREALMWDYLRRSVPKVVKVRLTPGGGGWLHAIVAIEKNSDGDAKTAIMAAFAAHPSLKHVIIVDPDIDVDDPRDVEWAIATRFRADRDLIVIHNARGSTLDPLASDGIVSKVGIDATAPVSDRHKFLRPRVCRSCT